MQQQQSHDTKGKNQDNAGKKGSISTDDPEVVEAVPVSDTSGPKSLATEPCISPAEQLKALGKTAKAKGRPKKNNPKPEMTDDAVDKTKSQGSMQSKSSM